MLRGLIEHRFSSLSLAGKLTALSMITSALSVTVLCIVLGTYDVSMQRTSIVNDASRLVDMIGASSAATVVFRDSAAAEETVRVVGMHPQIVVAAIALDDGTVLARYDRGAQARGQGRARTIDPDAFGHPRWHRFGDSTLSAASPIVLHGVAHGTAYLEFDLAELRARTRTLWLSLALALLGTVALAGVVGWHLQRVVSSPLLKLTAITRCVTRDRDYGIRATHDTHDEVGELVHGFNEMLNDIQRRDAILRAHQEELEEVVDQRTAELKANAERFRVLVESTQAVPWEADAETLRLSYIAPQASHLLGVELGVAGDISVGDVIHVEDRDRVVASLRRLGRAAHGGHLDLEHRVTASRDRVVDVRNVVSAHHDPDTAAVVLRGIAFDVTNQKKLEMELRQAQKLESVGRLAAGVAHEINTPVQFVSDSLHFVKDAVIDLERVIHTYERLRHVVGTGESTAAAVDLVDQIIEEADVEYLLHNMPKALDRSLEGLGRVATIVRSMKEFAHPDRKQMMPVDLNKAIQSTLVIARNEYKYVADVVTEFGELPLVACHAGDINQVILNIIVNAAQAIADVVGDSTDRGKITVRTRADGDSVVVEVSDTGAGIPEAIRERVFDPFFTTKEVGRGTGQGLSIARSIVAEKHKGALTFESEVGRGSTFFMRLPVAGVAGPEVAA